MYIPPKLKYSPTQLYKSDINDMVEEEMSKGGQGSGIKGHKTMAEAKRHLNQQEDAKHGRLDKLRGHANYWQDKYRRAKTYNHPKEDQEHYQKLRNEADDAVLSRLNAGSKDMKKESWNKIHGDHVKARDSGDEKRSAETGRKLIERLSETASKKVKPVS